MSVQSDNWIRERAAAGMIDPFEPEQVRKVNGSPVISYGASSYGYDIRCTDEFKIFHNLNSTVVDPKEFDENSFMTHRGPTCLIPPNSFVLSRTLEYIRVPRDVLAICLGKSTYARCGIIVNGDSAGAGMGGACDFGVFQHNAAAGANTRERGGGAADIFARGFAVRGFLQGPGRQISGADGDRPAPRLTVEGGGLRGGWIASTLLGLLEGLTEFLPISSTGHLIVAAHFLGENSEGAKLFEVVIQLGAIGAVCWEYRRRLFRAALFSDPAGRRLAMNLAVAFIPAAILGAAFHGVIKAHLFSPITVAWALMAGGAVIILVERRPRAPRISGVDDMTWRDALWVGIAQATALFPGVSRAGATIVGGMAARTGQADGDRVFVFAGGSHNAGGGGI